MKTVIQLPKTPLFWVFFFSVFVNVLLLTGPLFMLQVYDRVLASGSEETLIVLIILVAALFIFMGCLDFARGRLLARIGMQFQSRHDGYFFKKTVVQNSQDKNRCRLPDDVETVQLHLASPVILAFFDLPWSPIFFAAMFVLHPAIGWFGLGAGLVLVSISLANQFLTKSEIKEAQSHSSFARQIVNQSSVGSTNLISQGMANNMRKRWLMAREKSMKSALRTSDWSGGFVAISKSFRMFFQSAILGVGAYLTLKGELSSGSMIAGTILLGRALTPIDQSIGQWANLQKSRISWKRLKSVTAERDLNTKLLDLPPPEAKLEIRDISVLSKATGEPILKAIRFEIGPGRVLGIIGNSGSGKSTLANAIMGTAPIARGEVRLGGATFDQYGREAFARHVGYLPQEIFLFDGTIAENIGRMALAPKDQSVITAAKHANAHEMILSLPQGYQTQIGRGNPILSGGQRQRIALARALYHDPILLVLDEPNSALDAEGSAALNRTIRSWKSLNRSVVLMTHRPAAIVECDTLAILENGQTRAYGTKEDILNAHLKNPPNVARLSSSRNL